MGASISLCVEPGPTFSLLQAVRQGDVRTIRFRLGLDPKLLLHRSIGERETVWHVAATYGSDAVLDALAEHVPQLPHGSLQQAINSRNDKGQTPLMHAASQGNVGAVRWLLQKGADPWFQDRCGKRSALHYASMRGRIDCIVTLLDGLESTQDMHRCLELRSISGLTPLHYAVALRQSEAARVLLERGADLLAVNTTGHAYDLISIPQRSTPLHVVAAQNDLQSALVLLQHYHHNLAGPNFPDPRRRVDSDGRPPHRVALARGNGGLLAELLHPSSNLIVLFARSGAPDRPVVPRLAALAGAAVRRQLLEDISRAEAVVMEFRKRHPCGSVVCMLQCQTPFLNPGMAGQANHPDPIIPLQQQLPQQQQKREGQPQEHDQRLESPRPDPDDETHPTGQGPPGFPSASTEPAACCGGGLPPGNCTAASRRPSGCSAQGSYRNQAGPAAGAAAGGGSGAESGPRGSPLAVSFSSVSGSGRPAADSTACGDLSRASRRSQEIRRAVPRRFSREQPLPPLPGISVAPLLRPLRMSLPPRTPSLTAPTAALLPAANLEDAPGPAGTVAAAGGGAEGVAGAGLDCCSVRELSPFVRRSAGYVESAYSRAPLLPVTQCSVCLDDSYCMVSEPCHHRLCANCARDVTMRAAAMPPACPVCRLDVFQYTSPVCA